MKKASLLFFFIVFCSIHLLAQGKCILTVSTTGTSNLKIIYAGKKYSLQDRSQTFQNQNPGTYTLVIYQWQKKGTGSDYVKVYDGNVRLTNQKHLEITVMRFGKSFWDEGEITTDEWNENYQNPQPVNDQSGYNNNNQQGVNSTQFANVKKAMGAEYNEDDRLSLVKVIFKNNWFSTAQIKELAQTFYNEDRKLHFSKYAYDFCWDKGNYFTLTEIFYSTARKKELIEYLGTK